MATVTELINRVADMTGMGILNDDPCQEKDLILSFLNQAYQIAIQEASIGYRYYAGTIPAVQTGIDGFSLRGNSLREDILQIKNFTIFPKPGEPQRLMQKDQAYLEHLRMVDDSAGTPCYFAMMDDDIVKLYPRSEEDVDYSLEYVSEAPELIEVGGVPNISESTPSRLRRRWHYDLLANAAAALVLEYDQRSEEAAYYRGLADNSLQSLIGYLNSIGDGVMGPRMRNYYEQRWSSKNRSEDW